MSDALLKDDRHFTYADYKAWELDEGERYEVIDGVAYALSAPNDRHQAILSGRPGPRGGNSLPFQKSLRVYRFQGEQILSSVYVEDDTVVTPILPGLEIALGPVFTL